MKRLALLVGLLSVLTGCMSAQGIIGGGKPTTVQCKGKGHVTGGAMSFQADCGEGFEFKINVQ